MLRYDLFDAKKLPLGSGPMESAIRRMINLRFKGPSIMWRVENVEREGDRARLSLRIETGRTHQIRAQLAAVGAPVCGDVRYGGEPAPRFRA